MTVENKIFTVLLGAVGLFILAIVLPTRQNPSPAFINGTSFIIRFRGLRYKAGI